MSSLASRSTAVHELRVIGRVIAGLPVQPYAPDRWTVVFADFGHDLLVLGSLPTPDPLSKAAADQLAILHAQDLSSYEVTAPSAQAAERRAREYFAAERIGVTPWPATGLFALPGTPIPELGGGPPRYVSPPRLSPREGSARTTTTTPGTPGWTLARTSSSQARA
ncbi:hypothetical protein ACIHJG_34145 [Streptomyces sp. NPDC052415]|uniref:hypothetical protein n=1 Tax=Streptomyces sp. NPDC052415 TaxID=3365690 RepID=UPI0037CED5E3